MAKARSDFLMVPATMACGTWAEPKVKVFSHILMEMYIEEIGYKIVPKAMEYIQIRVVDSMKEAGIVIDRMELAVKCFLMAPHLKAISYKVEKKVLGSINGLMEPLMKVSGMTIKSTDSVYIHGLKVVLIQDFGKIV